MKFDKNNYDVKYYYIRNYKPRCTGLHPLACVCMVRNRATGIISRGISFCSTREKSFNKVAARGISFQRAVAADMTRMNFGVFRPTESTQYAVDTMSSKYGLTYPDGLVVKIEYGITPTEFEVGVWDDK